jgi:arsenate reductase
MGSSFPSAKKRVLFLCTANSARSQIAEGLLRNRAGATHEVWSAGARPSTVHPLAIAVLEEIGIDISGHTSKHVARFREAELDLVITVCDQAAETCPHFLACCPKLHWSLPDPAAVQGSLEERLDAFRRVRGSLDVRIRLWLLQEGNSLHLR